MKFNLCFLFFSIAILATLAKAHASSMVLSWTPSVSPDVAGYNVYYGTSSGNFSYKLNVGNADSVTIPNLISGATYYFVATAYNTRGTQSLFSDQIQVVVPSASSVNPMPSPAPTRPPKSTPSLTPKPAPRPVVPPTRNPQPPAPPRRNPGLPAHALEPASPLTARVQNAPVTAHQQKAVAVTAKTPHTTIALATTAVATQLTMAQVATPGSPATIRFSIQAGHQYEVQATTDFQNWTSIARSETADADGWMEFTDPDAKSFPSRFYRVVTY
jgi:hypothetical protein